MPFLWGLLVVPFVAAETVSLEQAQTAVRNWLSTDPALGCPLGMSVRSARTCSVTNGMTCHVVRLAEGGFVVTSTDTKLEPVIAFSDGEDLVEDDRNPLWALLKRDLAVRAKTTSAGGASLQSVAPTSPGRTESEVKWAKLLSVGARMQAVASVSDVRVAPFVKSKWDQTTCSSGNCYNYYTPNNYYCGCVATAGAQMMRYFQWPKATTSIASYTCRYCVVDTVQTTLTTQGGFYDWAQMPLDPNLSGTTEANRQMIGKLTSDIGIICGMKYGSGGSGTGGYMLDFAFKKFGYSNIMTYVSNSDLSDSSDMKNALLSNFDAKLPVMVSIGGTSGGYTIGHAIVGDGYGYSDNTLYIHLNYGWGGTGNAWYAPPSLNAGGNYFSVLDGFDYNIYTNQAAGSVICSGRVLTASGAPVAGATVRASVSGRTSGTAMTDEKGIYALYLAANSRPYTLTVTFGVSTATDSVVVKACTTMSLCSEVIAKPRRSRAGRPPDG
ncbi:MAG: C10 family peptidase, partial [bacterium]|nr:C10 family peptidase [bacterium]